MEELRKRILDAIQEIKSYKNNKVFSTNDIAKRLFDVKKKLLMNEINKLISDDILAVIAWEPIYLALKDEVESLKKR